MRKFMSIRWESHLAAATVFYAFCVFRSLDTTVAYFRDGPVEPVFMFTWSKNELSTVIVLLAYLIWLSFHYYRSLFRYFPESNPALLSEEYRAEIRETIRLAREHRITGYAHLAVTIGLFYLLAWNIAPPNAQQASIVAALIVWDLLLVLPYRRSAAQFSGICIGKFTGQMRTESEISGASRLAIPASNQAAITIDGPFAGDFYLENFIGNTVPEKSILRRWPRFSHAVDSPRLLNSHGRMYGGRLGSMESGIYVGEFNGVVQSRHGYRCWLVSPWRQGHAANEWWWFKNAAELLAVLVFIAVAPQTEGTPALVWSTFALVSVVLGIVLHEWAQDQFIAASASPSRSLNDPGFRSLKPDTITRAFLQR